MATPVPVYSSAVFFLYMGEYPACRQSCLAKAGNQEMECCLHPTAWKQRNM